MLGAINMFTGNENHEISLQEAAELTGRYREEEVLTGANPVLKGEYFSRDAIQALLANPLAVGIRIYYGLKPNGEPCMVLAGVEANMNDILFPVMEMGRVCPSYCGVNNVINS